MEQNIVESGENADVFIEADFEDVHLPHALLEELTPSVPTYVSVRLFKLPANAKLSPSTQTFVQLNPHLRLISN